MCSTRVRLLELVDGWQEASQDGRNNQFADRSSRALLFYERACSSRLTRFQARWHASKLEQRLHVLMRRYRPYLVLTGAHNGYTEPWIISMPCWTEVRLCEARDLIDQSQSNFIAVRILKDDEPIERREKTTSELGTARMPLFSQRHSSCRHSHLHGLPHPHLLPYSNHHLMGQLA